MKIYSHPEVLLRDHLRKVAFNCKTFIHNSFQGSIEMIPKAVLVNIGFICGAFHDLGKATQFFQHYLETLGKEKLLGPKSHALISALFVKQAVAKYLDTVPLAPGLKGLLVLFSYIAVRRHHGGLLNLGDEMFLADKSKELNEIIDAFYEQEIQEIIDEFLSEIGLDYHFSDFKKYIKRKDFETDLPDFYDQEFEFGDYDKQDLSVKIQLFYIFQLLFSSLLLADKTDVIVKEEMEPGASLESDCLEKYREAQNFNADAENPEGGGNINNWKNKAYYDTLANLRSIYNPLHYIYSITLPTGFGKTMTSFGVALELLKLNPSLKKLIITIPFTSIIDQNFEVYQSIVGTSNSSVILKHHHQAQPNYKSGEDDLAPNVSQFLIETWQSKIVVTTFVQLLNSIFSADTGLLMKIPNMANSVIILDEVQTINFKQWPLINKVFSELGKLLNSYFVLMSATQPLIFLPDKEIKEIVPDYRSYFKLFNRTRIVNKTPTPISLNDFVAEISGYVSENQEKDILVILNTKKSCRDVFTRLREHLDHEKCDLFFMSTLITPYERKRIIGRLKEPQSVKQKVVVTTQLVEAGVDISVDTVFRILSPIDSIIQAAGRGNRFNEKGYICDVFLYELEESRTDTARVYGADLMLKTKNVLRDIEEIEESNYLSLIEAYFQEVRHYSEHIINRFIGNIEKLEFDDLGQFSLIEERDTESVFVQLNEAAKAVWERFVQIYDEDASIFDKGLAFANIKSEFYNYVVNVPVAVGEKCISFDSDKTHGFYLVRLNEPTPFYKYSPTDFLQNTGYERVDNIFS